MMANITSASCNALGGETGLYNVSLDYICLPRCFGGVHTNARCLMYRASLLFGSSDDTAQCMRGQFLFEIIQVTLQLIDKPPPNWNVQMYCIAAELVFDTSSVEQGLHTCCVSARSSEIA